MGTEMPVLETERLMIRSFVMEDIPAIGRIRHTVDHAGRPQTYTPTAETAEDDRHYIINSIMFGDYLASLWQPPYGDRAVVLKGENRLIGAAGLVPCLGPFDQLPYFYNGSAVQVVQRNRTEMGLYYAFDPAYWRQGYATETARALIDYVFRQMNMKRIIATTAYENEGSIAVMRKLGMTIERNPLPEPEWFQVVGILENPMEA